MEKVKELLFDTFYVKVNLLSVLNTSLNFFYIKTFENIFSHL